MSDPNSSSPPAASSESKQGNPGGSSNRGRRSAKSTGGSSASGNGSRPHSRNANKKHQSQGQPANTQPGTGARNTDGASSDGKGSTGRRGGATSSRGGRGGRKQPSTANQRPNNKDAASPATTSPGESGSSALSNLQKAIADLKAMPNNGNQATSASATQPVPPTQSTLTPSAPPFHPASFVAPAPEVPPRHRKAQSMGPTPQQQIQSYSSLGQYTPGLDSMNEDGEFQPTETVSPLAQFGRHQAMGSFTAPRFAALQGQGTQQPPGEGAASGRPQLAPSFQFGNKRRTNSVSIGPPISEEDAGFQFPQTPQTPQGPQNPQNPHKRSGSEIMAEQIALQSQIEALQQQQQQLLAQQMAAGQVMGSSISAPNLSVRGAAHRRIQSQQVPSGPGFPGASNPPQNVTTFTNQGGGLGIDQAGMPRGHGRRHSVNVVNKGHASAPSQFFSYNGLEGFDDGFQPPPPAAGNGNHSRAQSRADSSWRINGGAGAVGAGNGYQADLAQAQAQLQSLAQFRAASGGHHAKMPSFNFPNMLPNMMAANMMGLGGINLLQQQQQFQMQLQQQNQPQRKSLFAPYLPQASLPPLLAAGKLVVGILRVNKRNRSDAYVATEVLDADIYICGSKDRNRALEGDIVAVELLNVDEVWATKKEKEEKKRKKEENAAYDMRAPVGRKNEKKKDDVEVEGQGLGLFEDEEVTDDVKPQFAGHVVAVVERMPGQLFSGTLGLLRPSSAATKEKQEAERREREGDRGDEGAKRVPTERPKIVWFKPTDKRVPLIAIPTEQAPSDFVENSESYADRLFVACIKRHPISSLHPFGTLVEELGPIGDVEVETSALLKDCNFPTEEFSENVLKCMPPIPWTIPEREFEVRKDLRAQRLFSIDPDGAKDIDDVLSITTNKDGTFDVGVHIADVSYFVKPNTALDRDARKRATSVYLVQRAVPMLPPTLSEQLCSLVPGEERLAFSVVFTLTEDARIINKWFGRTTIKSAAKLTYADAQAAIDGGSLPSSVAICGDHDKAEIAKDIIALNDLAQRLRKRRAQNGSLRIDRARLMFHLDENGTPFDCYNYIQSDSNRLIEEFMLLTNFAVAQQIAVNLPEQALLRRHEEPIERRIVAFQERARRVGFEVDISSAGALQRSFEAIENPDVRYQLENLATKAMQRAKYFCAGMLDIAKYQHYALNTPLYTHFTSPIRRYADVLIHRQLDAVLSAIEGEFKFAMDRDSVAKVAQHCNIKQDMAKLAQEQSAHLYLCLMISDLTQRYGPVVRQAKVVGVLDAAFDVIVPEFGIEKRVHIDQIPIENHVYDEHLHKLQIYWSERDVISWLADNSDDEHLKKVKQTAQQHALNMEVTSRSVNDESALFDDENEDDEQIVVNRTGPAQKETSKQRLVSIAKSKPEFEGVRTTAAGHRIQEVKELMTVPVIVTADLMKSPPVIKVYAVNPYAKESASGNK